MRVLGGFLKRLRGSNLREVRFVIVLLYEILLLGWGQGRDVYHYDVGSCCELGCVRGRR